MEMLRIESEEGTFEAISEDGEVKAYRNDEKVADTELGSQLFDVFAQVFEQFAENTTNPVEVLRDGLESMLQWADEMFGESVTKSASFSRESVIRKTPDKDEWCVYSEKGRSFGCYPSKPQAEKRLQQIEYFKHQDTLKESARRERSDEFSLQIVESALNFLKPQTTEQQQAIRIAQREFGRYAQRRRRAELADVEDYWKPSYFLRREDSRVGTLPSDHPPTAWEGTFAV